MPLLTSSAHKFSETQPRHLPEGGFGDAAFFVLLLLEPAAISDLAGHVGNMLGSIALGDS